MRNPFKRRKPQAIHLITAAQLQEYMRTGDKTVLFNPDKPTVMIQETNRQ